MNDPFLIYIHAMKLISIFLFLVSFVNFSFGQKVPIPKDYSIVDSVSGDLDKDGVKELAVAYNIAEPKEDFESVPRELIIYKQQNGQWNVWKKSTQALYGSKDGGMMGDPHGEMKIEKGVLSISHEGGSSWKWSHTDIYRYQNYEFYLIGYTSYSGRNCEYWIDVDFNLSTGKLEVKKDYEDCENDQGIYKTEKETFYKKGLKITLLDRRSKKILITSPKYKHHIYIAIKSE